LTLAAGVLLYDAPASGNYYKMRLLLTQPAASAA
jgi:hypothetical protein